jgi:hypothetical protein
MQQLTNSLSDFPANDYEVYCFLKYRLKPKYCVQAQPSTGYYSEWLFHYEISDETSIVEVLEGDFRSIEPGSLVRRALQIVERLAGGAQC